MIVSDDAFTAVVMIFSCAFACYLLIDMYRRVVGNNWLTKKHW